MFIDVPFVHFHEEICPACGARAETMKVQGIKVYSCKRCGMKYTREVVVVAHQKEILPANN